MVQTAIDTLAYTGSSHYIRNSWMLCANVSLEFPDSRRIRFLKGEEAAQLAEQVQKRTVFTQHSKENEFYFQRANELADRTIIEVFLPGDPQSVREKAEEIAMQMERIAVLSSTLVLKKADLLRKLGISSKPKTEINFTFTPDFRLLSSTSRLTPQTQGLLIDELFAKRFAHCGFYGLAQFVFSESDLARRVSSSLQWLFDSRIEPRVPAAVVKSSIALESLLVFSETEALSQSLAERAAFILSSHPSRRQQISRIVKRFYEVRSGVVHGNPKKAKKLTPALLETIDRLAVLVNLVIAANAQVWADTETLRLWCESRRWGEPSGDVVIPFSDTYLKNVLAVGSREME